MIRNGKLTSLPNEQKEPDAPGEVEKQRDCISWIPEEVKNRKEGAKRLSLHPRSLYAPPLEHRMWRRPVFSRRPPDEGRSKPPGQAHEDEGEHVVHGRW